MAKNGFGKTHSEKNHVKNSKQRENKMQIGACEQKNTNFCSNTISNSALKLE